MFQTYLASLHPCRSDNLPSGTGGYSSYTLVTPGSCHIFYNALSLIAIKTLAIFSETNFHETDPGLEIAIPAFWLAEPDVSANHEPWIADHWCWNHSWKWSRKSTCISGTCTHPLTPLRLVIVMKSETYLSHCWHTLLFWYSMTRRPTSQQIPWLRYIGTTWSWAKNGNIYLPL